MTRTRSIFIAVLIAALLMVPAAVASADSHATGPADPPPIAITGPRLAPPAIPHSSVIAPDTLWNNLTGTNLPAQSLEADAANGGANQQKPGRGIKQTITEVGVGIQLFDIENTCNDFNKAGMWPSTVGQTDVWTDWYAGWAPFAIDNGYYQAKNVTFSRERVVGPGNQYGKDQHAAKIASNQPYAAGFGSPIIPVPDGYEGGQVYVHVDYLIWDHDTYGWDYDWASMGVKAGAAGDSAVYVNGYVRGEWAELVNVVDIGGAKDVMVLLQGHSPAAFNSNIYFDNVQIAFINADGEGAYLADCTLAETVK